MQGKNPDRNADILAVVDAGERVPLMEPMLLGSSAEHRSEANDLALELAARSSGLRRSLPPSVCTALAGLIRAMNCYYSNLIEGHDTHPVDIERALRNDYAADEKKRSLQLEALAHIAVQEWIDASGLAGRAVSRAGLCELHRRFCERLPDELSRVADPDTGEMMAVIPGALRTRHVKVGLLVPVSPGAVPRFLARFEEAYCRLGRTDSLVAAAGAHHRLLWIHPFLDGNGRVARLMSHATLSEVLETGGLWSVARGLARSVADYKAHLAACDGTRHSDLDGRGHLSEEALAAFTTFFLSVCVDQVRFMEGLMQPDQLRTRVLVWSEEETRLGRLPARSASVLDAMLYRGALPRGEVAGLVGTGERQARRIVADLSASGAVSSAGPRAPLTLAFPATLASRWMPGLFPEQTAAR